MAARSKATSDPALPGTVAVLASQGLSISDIHARLVKAGKKISRATVGRMVQAASRDASSRDTSSSTSSAAAPTSTAAPAVTATPEHIDALIDPLRAIIPKLTEMVERALEDDESAVVNAGLRTLSQLTMQISRLQPPPPPDPNDHPDMIAAARMARNKLTEYVQRAALGK